MEKAQTSTSRMQAQRAPRGSRLVFAGELEQEFRVAHLARARGRTRLWQSIELLVPPSLALLYDRARGGAEWQPEVLACLGISMALSLVLALLAFLGYGLRVYLRAASWLTPARSIAYTVVIAAFVGIGGAGTAVLTASTFGHFFFSGLLFHQAFVAALAVLAGYLAALLWFDVPAGVIGYAVVTLGAVQTMAAVVAHDAQRAARIAFLEHGAVLIRAEHDGLTGLRNRRDFDQRFAAYWDQALAVGEPLTVLMIDVDHFKAYNDRYGHQAGDEVLRRVARAVRVAARGSDVVARYGGEEFVMLAPGLDEPAAAALGERIRATVEQLAIPHEESECGRVVTISVGAAHVLPLPDRTPAGVLQLADENLYRAKRQGRNSFVLHGADYDSLRTGRFRHDD
ncbi:MAG: diguanylate cyclase [Steroidobacteraceae bacterium]